MLDLNSDTARIFSLSGIHNFRDYGGYHVAGGGRVRAQMLFRSGQHVDATDADLTVVDALDIGTVIDLRGNGERAAHPCRRSASFGAAVLFHDGETAGRGGAPHVEAVHRPIATPADATSAMIDLYAFMPMRPNLQAILSRYFAALAAADRPSLVHCFAGKDRTGLAVALLHTMLGVHPDDVIADYLLTNVAGNSDARIAAGAQAIRATRSTAISDAALRILMEVDAAYLDTAFATITREYGSIESYFAEVLAVDANMRARILAFATEM